MDALDQSDALIRRGDMLRAQSVRIRASADQRMAKSRRLIAAAHEAVVPADGGGRPDGEGEPRQMTCPQADRTAAK